MLKMEMLAMWHDVQTFLSLDITRWAIYMYAPHAFVQLAYDTNAEAGLRYNEIQNSRYYSPLFTDSEEVRKEGLYRGVNLP